MNFSLPWFTSLGSTPSCLTGRILLGIVCPSGEKACTTKARRCTKEFMVEVFLRGPSCPSWWEPLIRRCLLTHNQEASNRHGYLRTNRRPSTARTPRGRGDHRKRARIDSLFSDRENAGSRRRLDRWHDWGRMRRGGRLASRPRSDGIGEGENVKVRLEPGSQVRHGSGLRWDTRGLRGTGITSSDTLYFRRRTCGFKPLPGRVERGIRGRRH